MCGRRNLTSWHSSLGCDCASAGQGGRESRSQARATITSRSGKSPGTSSSQFDAVARLFGRIGKRLVRERWKRLSDICAIGDQLDHKNDHEPAFRIDAINRSIRTTPTKSTDRIQAVRAEAVGRFKTKAETKSGVAMKVP